MPDSLPASGLPTPGQTLAVLLGASYYRYAPNLAHGPAFYNSSQQFGQYLTDTANLPQANIATFFDETRSASDQLRDIRAFLEHRTAELKNLGTPARDLIVHYVGHGLFSGGSNDYCLAVRSTEEQDLGYTSIRMHDLASVIRTTATVMRKFLILDCCFSGAAYTQFQSGPLSVVKVKVRDVLDDESPLRGTSLLCSASAKDPSVAPKGLPHTMFSDSLLTILTEGHEAFGPHISFTELGDLVRLRIRETYKDGGVRPEVHSPDQEAGDVARIPLFPNPAWNKAAAQKSEAAGLAQKRKETENQAKARAEAERIAREKAEAATLAQKRAEAERQAKAKAERIAREKADAARLAQQSAEAERQAKAKADSERIARQDAEIAEMFDWKRTEPRSKARLRTDAAQVATEWPKSAPRLTQKRTEAQPLTKTQAEAAKPVDWGMSIVVSGISLLAAYGGGFVLSYAFASYPTHTSMIIAANIVLAIVAGISAGILSSTIMFRWLPVLCAPAFITACLVSRAGSSANGQLLEQMVIHIAIVVAISFWLFDI